MVAGDVEHLSERFEVILARTLSLAKDTLHKRDDFDVAVIDLSLSGDAPLPPGKRHNVGIELLEILEKQNEEYEGYKPVLAFSQNFEKEPSLMSLVLNQGALPVPKTCTDTGYEALSSAIFYLAKVRPPGSKTEDPVVAAARVNKSSAIAVALITAVVGLIGGILVALIGSE